MIRCKKVSFYVLFILVFVLLFVIAVSAAPVNPRPPCRVNVTILNVTYHKGYFQEDNGLPCFSNGRDMPAKYLLAVRIQSVSAVEEADLFQERGSDCSARYPVGNEMILTIAKSNVNPSDSFKKDQVIEGDIHFAGDECSNGLYLSNYRIIKSSSADVSKGSSGFFSRIWSWIASLFG